MPVFTIFTGTYNSSNIIHRVFSSIDAQTFRDFEWVVIDDCSQDDTIAKIEAFVQQRPELSARIVRHTQNTGVATSRKEALQMARGKHFVTWDHDDEQDSHQLQLFSELWDTYEKRDDIGCIFAKMTDQSGVFLGKPYPTDPYVSDYISVHNQYLIGNKSAGIVTEHHACAKTAVFREVLSHYDTHPDLLDGMTPNGGDIWGMMAYLGYKTIYSNQTVRRYYINEAGRETLSSVKRKVGAKKIFKNKVMWVNMYDPKLPISQLKYKIRNIFAVAMYGYMANYRLPYLLKTIKGIFGKGILLMLYIPATILGNRFLKE